MGSNTSQSSSAPVSPEQRQATYQAGIAALFGSNAQNEQAFLNANPGATHKDYLNYVDTQNRQSVTSSLPGAYQPIQQKTLTGLIACPGAPR